MVKHYQIECVPKSDWHSPLERVIHVEGNSDGGWQVNRQTAIDWIESGRWALFVRTLGRR